MRNGSDKICVREHESSTISCNNQHLSLSFYLEKKSKQKAFQVTLKSRKCTIAIHPFEENSQAANKQKDVALMNPFFPSLLCLNAGHVKFRNINCQKNF